MTLQEQFPLSPLKFWKKLLGSGGGSGSIVVFTNLLLVTLTIAYGIALFSKVDATLGVSPSFNILGYQMQQQTLLMLIIAGIVALIIFWYVLKAWYVSAYVRSYFYDADSSFISIRKGVFKPAEIHVQWGKVQDVYVDQDVLDRLFGIYDVHIASATTGSAIEAHIDGVDKNVADGLKMFILERVQSGANPPAMNAATSVAPTLQNSHETASSALQEVVGRSSVQYPITGRWLFLAVIGWFVSALFFAVFVVLFYLTFAAFQQTGTMLQGGNFSTVMAHSSVNLEFLYTAAVIVIFVYQVTKLFIWRNLFRFEFMPEYLVIKSGIVSREEKHILYRSVQDVIVQQTFLGRILGIATVQIQNAAGGGGFFSTSMLPGLVNEDAQTMAGLLRKVALSANASRTGL